MSRINLNDTPFEGVSRSVTFLRQQRRRVRCLHCGSTLSGERFEKNRWQTIKGITYEVDVYRCGCGRGRHIRREVAAA